jgi:hypothetical protein
LENKMLVLAMQFSRSVEAPTRAKRARSGLPVGSGPRQQAGKPARLHAPQTGPRPACPENGTEVARLPPVPHSEAQAPATGKA